METNNNTHSNDNQNKPKDTLFIKRMIASGEALPLIGSLLAIYQGRTGKIPLSGQHIMRYHRFIKVMYGSSSLAGKCCLTYAGWKTSQGDKYDIAWGQYGTYLIILSTICYLIDKPHLVKKTTQNIKTKTIKQLLHLLRDRIY